MAEVLRQGLAEEGYLVTLAADGRQGLSLAESGGFDRLLLDVMPPASAASKSCGASAPAAIGPLS